MPRRSPPGRRIGPDGRTGPRPGRCSNGRTGLAGREVVARRYHRPEVLDVEAYRTQIALPPHHVQRMEGVDQRGVAMVPLHPHDELALLVVRLRLRCFQDPRVEEGVLAQDALLRQAVLAAALDHVHEVVIGVRQQAMGGPLGDDHVVTRPEREGPVVRLDRAVPTVDEVAEVAVRVPQVVRRGFRRPGDVDGHVLVPQGALPLGAGLRLIRWLQPVEVVGPRPEVTLHPDPRRGRVGPVEVRGSALEGLPAVLLLERTVRQPDMGLPGNLAPGQWEHPRSLLWVSPFEAVDAPRPSASAWPSSSVPGRATSGPCGDHRGPSELLRLASLGQLRAALAGGVDGVEEGGPNPRLLQGAGGG